jgi:hypothetical protein
MEVSVKTVESSTAMVPAPLMLRQARHERTEAVPGMANARLGRDRIGRLLAGLWLCMVLMGAGLAASPASILVIRPVGGDFELVKQGIAEELSGEFTLQELVVNGSSGAAAVSAAIERSSPQADG